MGTATFIWYFRVPITLCCTDKISVDINNCLVFPLFCSNKGFIGTFIGFRPYLRDLLRMQKSIQSLDMTNCGDEEPLKVFLSNLPIFSCWKCYTIESLFGKMSSGLTLLSNSGFSRLLMLVLEKYLQGVPTCLE